MELGLLVFCFFWGGLQRVGGPRKSYLFSGRGSTVTRRLSLTPGKSFSKLLSVKWGSWPSSRCFSEAQRIHFQESEDSNIWRCEDYNLPTL